MRQMGIDYGTKRVGVALSDPDGTLAFPLETLANTNELISELLRRITENDVDTVVIGESRDLSGNANPVYEASCEFAKALGEKVDATIVFEPEYLTSVHARRLQGETGHTDASAAAIILQTYLDKQSTNSNET